MKVYKFFLNALKDGEIKYQMSGFTFANDIDFARELAYWYGKSEYGDFEIVVNDVHLVVSQFFGVKESKFQL